MRKLPKIPHFRWWIAGLLALASAINYLDRQNLPVVISELRKSIPITEIQYSHMQFLFLLAYGLMYAVGGRIMDVLGTRLGYVITITWWSIANMLQGLVSSVAGLGIARFLLGVGEGGGFPGSAKAVSEWFPVKERSLAFGIFNTGSSVGAVIAPPLIAYIVLTLNWRWVFIITGAFGLIWAVLWLWLYNPPSKSQYVSEEEKHFIETNRTQAATASIRWLDLFKYRKIIGLLMMKILSDAAWYFFIFWLPKYLADVRGLNIKEIGYCAWIPYAFAGGGSMIGGWLSSFLMRKNLSLDVSRKICLFIPAAMMPASLFISNAPLSLAIVFFSMAMFAHQFWSTIVQTLPADICDSSIVGSVAGIMGAAGSFGGMLFSLLAGFLITKYGYAPVFIIAGIMHPLSFIMLLSIVRKIEVIEPVKTR